MSTTMVLEAELRTDHGKGASRRLRRLENKVPGVLYGGDKKPKSIHISHNKLMKALESESIYSSVFDLHLDGKTEKVILKDLQRHPYRPIILHMDLQRVSAKDILIKMIPVHFINEEKSQGIKDGGVINHTMTQVEVKCQAKDLPEFIEVDLAGMKLDDVVHMSDMKLPKNVHFAIDPKTGDHDHPVVSIHLPRVQEEVEEIAEEAVEGEAAAPEASAESEDKAE